MNHFQSLHADAKNLSIHTDVLSRIFTLVRAIWHMRFKTQSKYIAFAPIVAQLMFNQAEAWTAEGADRDPELEQRCFQGNPQHQAGLWSVMPAADYYKAWTQKNWLG